MNKNKKILLFSMLLFLVLAGLGIGGYFYINNQKKVADEKQSKDQQITSGTVELPASITYEKAINPDPETKTIIKKQIADTIKSLKVVPNTDYIPIVVKDGKPVMPDAVKKYGEQTSFVPRAFAASEEKMTYVLDDSNEPWTPAEKQFINNNLPEVYEHVKSMIGSPAFSQTVHIKKTTTSRGSYSPWDNEMVIYPVNPDDKGSLGTLVHEMTHSFNDDFIFNNRAFEEGTAMMVEKAWERKYSYNYPGMNVYDSVGYYENNQPLIATGSFYSDSFSKSVEPVSEIDHYYMSGYGMEKIYFNDKAGVSKFRSAYFQKEADWIKGGYDTNLQVTNTTLRSILKQGTPKIDGENSDTWLANQYMFEGTALTNLQYLGIFNQSVYFMKKNASDTYSPSSDYNVYYYNPVTLEIRDINDKIVKKITTNPNMRAPMSALMVNDYAPGSNFFKVTLSSNIGKQNVSYTLLRYVYPPKGTQAEHSFKMVNPKGVTYKLKDASTGQYITSTKQDDYIYSDQVDFGKVYVAESSKGNVTVAVNAYPYTSFGSFSTKESPLAVHWLSPRDPDVAADSDSYASTTTVFKNGVAYYPNSKLNLCFYLSGRYDSSTVTLNGQASYIYGPRACSMVDIKAGENKFRVQVKDLAGKVVTSDRTIILGTVGQGSNKVDRVYGADRYETAVKISQAKTSLGSRRGVVIASGENWPDSISASVLASSTGSSLLYVKKDSVPTVTLTEIRRLKPYVLYIVGGTGSVSQQVQDTLTYEFFGPGSGMDPQYSVMRFGGTTRYDTNLKVMNFLFPTGGATGGPGLPRTADTIIVATGNDFPDGGIATPVASAANLPLFLVGEKVTPDLLAKVSALKAKKTIVVGGTTSVSDAVMKQFPGAVRIAGTDRYKTAIVFANYAKANLKVTFGTVGLATGTNYPDVFAAGNYLGDEKGVVVLTGTGLNKDTEAFVKTNASKINIFHVFGSSQAIGNDVYNKIKNMLNDKAVLGISTERVSFFQGLFNFVLGR